MSIVSLAGVLKIFGGSDPTPEEQEQLAKEVMLMTLARATAADTNISAVEVDKVREVLMERTGEDVPESEIRVVAKSGMWEKAPLEKYLSSSARKLRPDDCISIVLALWKVLKVDDRLSDYEAAFFDSVSNSLGVTASQLMEARPDA